MVSLVSAQNELNMTETELRTYRRDDVISFRKTGEAFGGLSNMAPGFPIWIFERRVRTAEALYQACRYPHLPHVQRMILNEASPMTAKMRSKPYREESRADWERVRVPIMKWCLRVKLIYNWQRFSELLLATGEKAIVEDSRKDQFWGAKPDIGDNTLTGQNVLGRLLMELREQLRSSPDALRSITPVRIDMFLLDGRSLPTIMISEPSSNKGSTNGPQAVQGSFL